MNGTFVGETRPTVWYISVSQGRAYHGLRGTEAGGERTRNGAKILEELVVALETLAGTVLLWRLVTGPS